MSRLSQLVVDLLRSKLSYGGWDWLLAGITQFISSLSLSLIHCRKEHPSEPVVWHHVYRDGCSQGKVCIAPVTVAKPTVACPQAITCMDTP